MSHPIDQLTPEQLEPVRQRIERGAAWLDELHSRLSARGLRPLHPILKAIVKAQRAVRELGSHIGQCQKEGILPNAKSVVERNAQ